jgi:preprotein translocase subunit SecY
MFRTFINIFKIPELRNKVLFTVGLLAIYRIGFYVPVPGVNQEKMTSTMAGGGALGQLTEYFQLFTGGNLQQSTIFGLGIMPYISASRSFSSFWSRWCRRWRSCPRRASRAGAK